MKETIRQYPAPQAGEKELLRQRALDGAERRFGALEGERKERLFYELQLVRKMQAEGLFLLWERAISAVKRVVFPYVLSAHNCSLLCFCIGITEVDPFETGSYPERLLLPGERIPPLPLFVPADKLKEAAAQLTEEERAAVELLEREMPFIDPQKAAEFFRKRPFEDEELLLKTAKQLGIEHLHSVAQLSDTLVALRFKEFMEGEPPLEFQEEAVGLLCGVGFSSEEAERIRRAFLKKDEGPITFYRLRLHERAKAEGLDEDDFDDIFDLVRREGLYTICRASYLALAQYLMMQSVSEGGTS